ncbi:MAG: tetratricopeptide repeat protein [Bacteroidota bacterium]
MRYLSAILCCYCFLIIDTAKCKGTFVMNDNCIIAYKNIIDLKLEKGSSVLSKEKLDNPQNLIPLYLENFIDFLKLFLGENKVECKKTEKYKSIRLKQLEAGDKSSPYYLFTQAEVYLQWAFIHIKFQEYLSSAREINEAYSLLEKNQKLFPKFILNKKGLGILHALIGTIPDKYKWIANIAGFQGTVKQGIFELSDLFLNAYNQPKYNYLLPESLFYLNFLTSSLSNDEAELNTLYKWQLKLDTIKSPLYLYSKASLLKKKGENDKIISMLQNRQKSVDQFQFHYLTYILGESKLFKLDYSAITYFEEYIKNFKGLNFIKASWLRISWAHLINGNIEKYKLAMANLLKYGNAFVDEDKYAENEAKRGNIPNITLLKARLLFDGGYYSRSLSLLLEKEPSQYASNPKDFAEFYYRLARNYHQLKKFDDALKFYQLCLNKSININEYFIPNAALQMGLIYEKQGNITKAKEYLNKCLNMDDCDYKSGIDQKAKAALSRMK